MMENSQQEKRIHTGKMTNELSRVEHFPGLDVVINSDYVNQNEVTQLLDIIKENAPVDGSIYNMRRLKFKVESIHNSGDGVNFTQRYYVKIKGNDQRHIDFILSRSGGDTDPIFPEHRIDYTIPARYAREGVMSEIVLSKQVRDIIDSPETQELAKSYGYAGVRFAEALMALVDKSGKNGNLPTSNSPFVGLTKDNAKKGSDTSKPRSNKYLIYRKLVRATDAPKYDQHGFLKALRKIFIKNGIFPADLKEYQLLETYDNGKFYINILDIESYYKDTAHTERSKDPKVRSAILEIKFIQQQVNSRLGYIGEESKALQKLIDYLEEGAYSPEEVDGVLAEARSIGV